MSGPDATEQPDPPRRDARLRVARLVAVGLALLLPAVAVVAFIVMKGPPSRQALLEDAGLTGKRELIIGVKDDTPGISLRDPVTGQFSGFDIDIAHMVAADLGFQRDQVRFLPIETEDRPKMQAREGDHFVDVDLVIASYSITRAREELPSVSFSAPYLRTEQSVVTRVGHSPVDSLEDLRGKTVCTLATSTSETAVSRAGAVITGKNRISECVDGLLKGAYDAVTTDAAILAGFVVAHRKQLKAHDIGLDAEERWGVNTGGNEALRTLVNLSLYNSLHDPRDQRWEEAFDRYLRGEQAANLPQQVAIDHQPEDIPHVRIRQWPWERVGAATVVGAAPLDR
ncbi:hypothetical protein GCM10009682_02990 [Luedemannella flava]|uniref:Solute-binding protein family 3/N-terminal domain-containing protein n=1 Tax=Luedemannella flava TaxID=349316 RepID=A0ABP4XNA8_9ACTN